MTFQTISKAFFSGSINVILTKGPLDVTALWNTVCFPFQAKVDCVTSAMKMTLFRPTFLLNFCRGAKIPFDPLASTLELSSIPFDLLRLMWEDGFQRLL
jgi:hypothetical protein